MGERRRVGGEALQGKPPPLRLLSSGVFPWVRVWAWGGVVLPVGGGFPVVGRCSDEGDAAGVSLSFVLSSVHPSPRFCTLSRTALLHEHATKDSACARF